MGKVKMTAKVVSQQALTDDIFSMWIQADEIAGAAVPGQFISVYTKIRESCFPVLSAFVRLIKKRASSGSYTG